MFREYYNNERIYLTELGKEFSERYPDNTAFLASGAIDPDVERLLEGFSFLTARLHQRLDSQFSEIAEAFLSVMWPQAIRPIPAVTIAQFTPEPGALPIATRLARGCEIRSKDQPWGNCIFKTSRDVVIHPFNLSAVEVDQSGDDSFIRLKFALNPGASLDPSMLGELPMYLFSSDKRLAAEWYLWLTQRVSRVLLVSEDGSQSAPIELQARGMEDRDSLFPEPVLAQPGYRIMREYFAFPDQFYWVALSDLGPLASLPVQNGFEVIIDFGSMKLPASLINSAEDIFQLYCTPCVNLFETSARITLDNTRTQMRVRSDDWEIDEHEIYSVDRVCGFSQSSAQKIEFAPYYESDFSSEETRGNSHLYRIGFQDIGMKRKGREVRGKECLVTFHIPESGAHSERVRLVDMELTCTNRRLAENLAPGDLSVPGIGIPAGVSVNNLGAITRPVDAPEATKNYWLLISHFMLSHETLNDVNRLCALLSLYKTDSISTTQLDRLRGALRSISARPNVTLENGAPLRKLDVTLDIDIEPDAQPEFYLLGGVIAEFLRHTVSVNTRLDFFVNFTRTEEVFQWPTRRGDRPAI